MAQFSLFQAGPQVLLDDASGRIVYMPDLVPLVRAQAWFAQLMEGIAWRGGRRMMYEREVDVPRLRAHFELADPALPGPVAEALEAVRGAVDAPFTSVGLNLYRDEHDSVAPHNDKLEDLVRGHPIALLSLGATREMVIRANRPPRRALHLDLAPGSLLLMDHTSQFHYDHGIPKQRTPMAPRISLAFRVRPASSAMSSPHADEPSG